MSPVQLERLTVVMVVLAVTVYRPPELPAKENLLVISRQYRNNITA